MQNKSSLYLCSFSPLVLIVNLTILAVFTVIGVKYGRIYYDNETQGDIFKWFLGEFCLHFLITMMAAAYSTLYMICVICGYEEKTAMNRFADVVCKSLILVFSLHVLFGFIFQCAVINHINIAPVDMNNYTILVGIFSFIFVGRIVVFFLSIIWCIATYLIYRYTPKQ